MLTRKRLWAGESIAQKMTYSIYSISFVLFEAALRYHCRYCHLTLALCYRHLYFARPSQLWLLWMVMQRCITNNRLAFYWTFILAWIGILFATYKKSKTAKFFKYTWLETTLIFNLFFWYRRGLPKSPIWPKISQLVQSYSASLVFGALKNGVFLYRPFLSVSDRPRWSITVHGSIICWLSFPPSVTLVTVFITFYDRNMIFYAIITDVLSLITSENGQAISFGTKNHVNIWSRTRSCYRAKTERNHINYVTVKPRLVSQRFGNFSRSDNSWRRIIWT